MSWDGSTWCTCIELFKNMSGDPKITGIIFLNGLLDFILLQLLSLSKYSPFGSIHLYQCFSHCWNISGTLPCWCSRPPAFSFLLHWYQQSFLFTWPFIQGNRKKSYGARLGEKGGWGITVMLFFTKNYCTLKAVWAGALLWWRNKSTLLHILVIFSVH